MKTKLAGVLLLALAPGVGLAARAWLLPSQTVLARSGGWVTVDAAMADDLFAVVQSGAVTIPIAQRYALEDVQQAHRDLEARKTTGCTILTL